MALIKSSSVYQDVDWTNELTRGLRGPYTAAYLFGADKKHSLTNRNSLASYTATETVGQNGTQLSFNGSQQANTGINGIGLAQGTIVWSQRPNDAFNSGTVRAMWGNTAGSGSTEISAQLFSDNNFYIGWNVSGTDNRVTLAASASNWPTDKHSLYAFSWVQGGNSIFYRNGIELGRYTGSTQVSSAGSALTIGQLGAAWSAWFNGDIDLFYVFDVALVPQEVLALAINPYQILIPDNRVVFLGGAGSSAAITGAASGVGTATGTLSGGAAAIAGSATGVDTATGTLQSGSTFTTKIIKNNTRTVYASISGCTLLIYDPTTHALLNVVTGLTTNSSGVIATFVAGLVAGNYPYDVIFPSGARRLITGVAA